MGRTSSVLKRALRRAGYEFQKIGKNRCPVDFEPADSELVEFVAPYTLTSPERILAVRQAAEYVVRAGVPGDVVECGVWRGGSMMAVARTLLASGDAGRTLHLFDTYEGMPEPTDEDTTRQGRAASEIRAGKQDWCRASLDDVQRNLALTGYDAAKLRYVVGKVEETIPAHAPERIALLRLDTDFYESTYHEMVHLWPRLSVGGVLIIDDYGAWRGARKAVDHYVEENGLKLLLHRIDDTGRMTVKPPG